MPDHEPSPGPAGGPRLHGWRSPPVAGLAVIAAACGFGQFGAVAALADVAEHFGTVVRGDDLTLAEQAGLSGTVLGVGLAVIRLASIFSLPLTSIADAKGRRRTLLGLAALGLVLVAATAAAPSYWWFVAVFALSRPLLTASNAIAATTAAEQTGSADRAKAVALLAAGFGIGAGAFAVVRGALTETVGFRPVFALAILGVGSLVFAGRWVTEPDQYERARLAEERATPVLGAVHRRFLPRLLPVLGIAFAVAVVTGPANSFVFLYAESILGLAPGVSAGLVVGAGLTGLAGLLTGRWAADRFGRRLTGAAGLAGVAACGIVTYSGTPAAAGAGYLLAVFAGSVFAPAAGALHAELFPTHVRGTVAGWTVTAGVLGAVTGLVAFGAIADRADRFDLAALVVFLPAALAALLFAVLPETRGKELEESSLA